MTNNTKQSEETYIRWSVNMNSAIEVGQIEPEPILTIHPDGRVTTSPRLKPDEISALVLDQIKTAWLKDAQATKIRELQDRIQRLEEALDLVRPTCLFVHHSKKHQHKYNEPCPVVELIEKAKEAKP